MSLLSRFTKALVRPAFQRLGRGRLPQHHGRLYVPGLHDQVVVKRDRWSIPTIYAGNRRDLFLAQGFIHAEERLWQMEIHRRAAAGTLSALVGPVGLPTDRLSRTLGFLRQARKTWALANDAVKDDVLAYTAGINAFLKTDQSLSVEFSLLRHSPEPWTHLDSIAFGRMLAWVLSHGFAGKLTRARLLEKVGPEAAAELEPDYPPDNPVTLPGGIEFNLLKPDGMLRATTGPFIGRNMEQVGRGSNAWVLSGQRTATGSPFLCNDMHLPISTPSLWYVLHMCCPVSEGRQALNVAGVSLPGLPYVLVGHNDRIAWGATVSFIDNEDLFVERFSPGKANLYQYKGSWRQAETIDERIEVRGREDHIERVVITHHGPLISRVVETNGQALALASKSLEPSNNFDGFAMLNDAGNWDGFVAAVEQIESPSLNLFYADKAGNIGYYATGRAPVRQKGLGQVPVPGWTGEFEWTGEVPFVEMPHAFNPACGFLVNANNKIVGDDYPYFLGRSWRNGYRARRIQEFINERRELSIRDMRQLQGDLISIPALALRDLLQAHFVDGCRDPDAQKGLERLGQWDGRMDSESEGALLYKMLLRELSRAILIPRLGETLTAHYLGAGPHPSLYPFGETHSQWISVLLRMLVAETSRWLPGGETRTRILEQCLAGACRKLATMNGDNSPERSWGAHHRIVFAHTLSAQRPLDIVFDVGPFVVGGDADTVCQISIDDENPGNNIAPSFRQLIDAGNWDASVAMHAPGQSGHVASRHYADLAGPWLAGEYYQLSWSEKTVDRSTVTSVRLLPPIGALQASSE